MLNLVTNFLKENREKERILYLWKCFVRVYFEAKFLGLCPISSTPSLCGLLWYASLLNRDLENLPCYSILVHRTQFVAEFFCAGMSHGKHLKVFVILAVYFCTLWQQCFTLAAIVSSFSRQSAICCVSFSRQVTRQIDCIFLSLSFSSQGLVIVGSNGTQSCIWSLHECQASKLACLSPKIGCIVQVFEG